MKDYCRNKELSYLKYWDVNNLYGWAMAQKLPGNGFEWVKETSQFNEWFIESYSEEYDEGHFLEVVIQYLDKLHKVHNDLPFLPERLKIHKFEKTCMIKKICHLHKQFKTNFKSCISFKENSWSNSVQPKS